MPLNKIRLEICGSHYTVMSSESEEYLQGLAKRLDEDMNRLLAGMPTASVASASIITALGYLDEMQKAEESADNMRGQVHQYLEDAARARTEALEASRRLETLEQEIKSLKERLG